MHVYESYRFSSAFDFWGSEIPPLFFDLALFFAAVGRLAHPSLPTIGCIGGRFVVASVGRLV